FPELAQLDVAVRLHGYGIWKGSPRPSGINSSTSSSKGASAIGRHPSLSPNAATLMAVSLPRVPVAGVAAIVAAPAGLLLGFSKRSVEIGLIYAEFPYW